MSTQALHVRSGFRARPSRFRRGLSFLEFVACLAALGGGIAIGSVYLGIDLNSAGEKLLLETGLVDRVAAEEDAEQPAGGTEADAQPTAPERRTALDVRLPPMPHEIVEATVGFWSELTRVIGEDTATRSVLTAKRSETDVYEYLSARQALHQEIGERLQEIETDDVDPRVLAFGIQIRRWHEGGVEVYQNALKLMTEAPAAEISGPFGHNWRSAATQHRMEEKLLMNRLAAIEAYMRHSYPAD